MNPSAGNFEPLRAVPPELASVAETTTRAPGSASGIGRAPSGGSPQAFPDLLHVGREAAETRAHWGYGATKRTFDVVATLALVVALLPVLVLIALLIQVTGGPGPVFFKQKRVGKDGRVFEMIKFRTMVNNAAQMEEDLRHLSMVPWPDFKLRVDPRVTPFGRFLRKASLDELPNLINVLKGEMSLVGPRPIIWRETYEHHWPKARLRVRPGVTGLWQVSGRSNTGVEERIRIDLDYVERRSLLLDLKILLRTFSAVIRGDGAY